MNRFITGLINMNITAAYVIAVIYIIRLFIKKLPKKYSYMLWAIAGFRLIFPFSVPSVLSLFNISFLRNTGMEYIPADIEYAQIPTVNTGIDSLNAPVNSLLPHAEPMASVNPIQIILSILFLIWLGVFSAILIYKIILYIKTAKMVSKAVIYEDNIYQCDNIPTPFVMGILRPKIYIPFRMSENELSYIICHEKYHIKRHDTLAKTTASLLVGIHWFNPLVWLAYRSMTADMEESCDEAVIKYMGEDIKQDYSTSILSFALNRRLMPSAPLSFGEGSAERRIKNVLSYKRPRRIISLTGIILVIVFSFICITNGKVQNTELKNVTKWAEAFSKRDGEAIKSMSSYRATFYLLSETFYANEEAADNGWLGWSSPWPMGLYNTEAYRILSAEDGKAEILYYAWVSDPHVTVWRQILQYNSSADGFTVTDEKTEIMDAIENGSEFIKAYPDNITGTPMDYSRNGAGKYINDAYISGSLEYALGDPKTAALYFLNISDYAADVAMSETSYVNLHFKDDNTDIRIHMTQPFGSSGIWVPDSIMHYEDTQSKEAGYQYTEAEETTYATQSVVQNSYDFSCSLIDSEGDILAKYPYIGYAGCDVYIFADNKNMLGVMDSRGNVIIEPRYFDDWSLKSKIYAADDTITLKSGNRFDIYDTTGRLKKSINTPLGYALAYPAYDPKTKSPLSVDSILGSNVVVSESAPKSSFIIRLYSEKKVEGFYDIFAFPKGGFYATDKTDNKSVILNLDGSIRFKAE